jgi:tRNA(Ile)-lysidine synthase
MPARTPSPLRPPRALLARTRRYIVDHELIAPGSRVLAGVSGGADSTALLLILAALRASLRFELVAAHFDHGLRSARAAALERNTVRALCERLDVPFRSGAGDVRAHAKMHRLSLEEAARDLRYRYLASASGGHARCDAVAVGHTRDDQAETVLLHLLRGSGLRGLAGMSPSSAWPLKVARQPPRLIRPLLCLSRDETERCCRAAGLSPSQDPSNRSRAHLRNRIRHDLLPRLREYNPRIEDALARLASAAAGDVELLEALAVQALETTPTRGNVRIPRAQLIALPDALRVHVVRLAIARALGDTRGISERHVRAVLHAAGTPGTRLDLPRRLRAVIKRTAVVLSTAAQAKPRPLPARAVALPVPGTARIGSWKIEASIVRRPGDLRSANGQQTYIDASIVDHLSLRRRRPGDRFQPLGMSAPKKLQDFLVDARVPRDERDAIPLVCNGARGIVWVVGQRPAEWAKVTPSARAAIHLRAERAGA